MTRVFRVLCCTHHLHLILGGRDPSLHPAQSPQALSAPSHTFTGHFMSHVGLLNEDTLQIDWQHALLWVDIHQSAAPSGPVWPQTPACTLQVLIYTPAGSPPHR